MFLLDTNVWLEVLLDRKGADQARRLLEATDAERIAISEFSLYSLGVILIKSNKTAVMRDFLKDTVEDSGVRVLRLEPPTLGDVVDLYERYRLDFDDAYQYAVAERHGYTLVSFDADFDGTPLGRRTPAQVLAQ